MTWSWNGFFFFNVNFFPPLHQSRFPWRCSDNILTYSPIVEFIRNMLQLEKTTRPSNRRLYGPADWRPKTQSKYFWSSSKEFGDLCDWGFFVYNNLLKKSGNFVHIHLFQGWRISRVKRTQCLTQQWLNRYLLDEWKLQVLYSLAICFDARHWNTQSFNFPEKWGSHSFHYLS